MHRLANCQPIGEEILNAYIKLVYTKRCIPSQEKVKFHLFDTMFFHTLDSLFKTESYDFLKLTFYLDKLMA